VSDLLNTGELAAALGKSRTVLTRLKKFDPWFVAQFEVKQPRGQRRYSRVLVQRYLAGESLVRFGSQRRSA
jgi:hypothetical protein